MLARACRGSSSSGGGSPAEGEGRRIAPYLKAANRMPVLAFPTLVDRLAGELLVGRNRRRLQLRDQLPAAREHVQARGAVDVVAHL